MLNKEFLEKARLCATKQELYKASLKVGYNFAEEEVNNFFNQFHTISRTLSDEELENVIG